MIFLDLLYKNEFKEKSYSYSFCPSQIDVLINSLDNDCYYNLSKSTHDIGIQYKHIYKISVFKEMCGKGDKPTKIKLLFTREFKTKKNISALGDTKVADFIEMLSEDKLLYIEEKKKLTHKKVKIFVFDIDNKE